MATKKLIYIDESGDPGLAKNSSQFFILSAVVIDNDNDLRIQKITQAYAVKNHWSKDSEIKFSKTHKQDIVEILTKLNEVKYEAYIVCFDKAAYFGRSNRTSIYNEALLELLKIIKCESASVIIDGRAGRKYRRNVGTFLRKNLPFRVSKIKYVESKNNIGIQIADLIAGAFHRKHEHKTDANRYLKPLKTKIKKRGHLSLQGRHPSGCSSVNLHEPYDDGYF